MSPAERVLRSYEIAEDAKAIGNGDPASGLKAVAYAVGCEMVHEIGIDKTVAFLDGVMTVCRDIRPGDADWENSNLDFLRREAGKEAA
jgi:hypothetical protein